MKHLISPRHRTLRRTALVGILVAAIGGLSLTGATAANADDIVATSWSDVVADLSAQDSPIQLAPDLGTVSVDTGLAFLKTYADVTLDLNGNHLVTQGVIVSSGTTLTVIDSSVAGTGVLIADGSPQGRPGIADPSGSAVVIDSGEVDATGSYQQPAIGSGNGIVDPSSQTTQHGIGTISVNGGVVKAVAGADAAALGGGSGQPGTSVTIAAGAVVTATAGGSYVTGGGNSNTTFGSLVVAGTLNITSGSGLTVPIGGTATVASTGIIQGAGSVYAAGTLANGGIIRTETVSGDITGNSYFITFNPNLAFESTATPGSVDFVTVYAPSFSAAEASEPTNITAQGDYVFGWSPSADGTAGPWDETATLTGDITVYAQYTPLTSITVSAENSSASEAGSIALSATGHGPSGTTNDQSSFATYTSSDPSDTFGVQGIVLGTPGTRHVKAHVTSQADPTTTLDSTNTATVISTGPFVSGMTIAPLNPIIRAGDDSSFVVDGKDANGNDIGDITWEVTWSGLSASKGDSIDDTNEPVFGKIGTRTLKATIGTQSVSTTITVVPGAVAHITFVKPAKTATAGIPVAFTVDGTDIAGNSLGDITSHCTFASAIPASGETSSGNTVTFTLAGSRGVVAADGMVGSGGSITVVHGAASQITFAEHPLDVTAGTSLTYTPTVADAFGNLFTAAEVLKTLVIAPFYRTPAIPDPNQVVSKNKVTFKQAGTVNLRFTVGSASASQDQNVDPSPTVPKRLTFDFPTTTTLVAGALDFAAYPSDAEGNATGDAVSAAFATSSSTATLSATTGTGTTVGFAKAGKFTISASAPGYTKLSQTITVDQDTSIPTFPTSNITASIPSSFQVSLPVGASTRGPSGKVTLHFGSKSLTATVVTDDPSVATFSLPALKPGKYTFSASYSGDHEYKAKTTAKVSIRVVAGPVDHLAFVKPPTTVVAGATTTYVVDGYDINDNLNAAESTATYSVTAEDSANGESVVGAAVTLTNVGTRTVTASFGGFEISTTVRVVAGAIHTINFRGPVPLWDASSTSFNVYFDGGDAYGNAVPDPTAHVKIHSSFASDVIAKNIVKFTQAGTRHLTFTDGAGTGSIDFPVGASSPVEKITFGHTFAPKQVVYLNQPYDISAYPSDPFGNIANNAEEWDNPDLSYTIPGGHYELSHPVLNGGPDVSFSTLGEHKVTANFLWNGTKELHVSETFDVVKDAATIVWPTTPLPIESTQTFSIHVNAGASGITPTGTVTIHYGSHSISGFLSGGETSINVPPLAEGTYAFYVVYGGDVAYNPKTTPKVNIPVNQPEA